MRETKYYKFLSDNKWDVAYRAIVNLDLFRVFDGSLQCIKSYQQQQKFK